MPQKIVGIDIGSTALRGVELGFKKGKPVVLHAAEIALPENVIVAGELKEPSVLVNALKLLWKSGKFTTKNVAIGVGNQQTLVRQVDLALEEGEDFKAMLPFKVSQDLPVDSSELSLDYYPLGDYIDANGNARRKALLVGAMNVVVENFTETLTEAGLKPILVDFSGFSLIRTAVYTTGNPADVPAAPLPNEEYPCEVLVDVGANVTIVAIHRKGRPLFVRITQGGGDSVTRAISDHLQIRWEAADALKRALGIGGIEGVDAETKKIVKELTSEQVKVTQQIINMMASSLVQIVRESTEYFLAASPRVTEVSRILLSGGGVLLPGYGERLASELRTEVGFLAPMKKFSKDNRKEAYMKLDPKFSLAFGLCLGVDQK